MFAPLEGCALHSTGGVICQAEKAINEPYIETSIKRRQHFRCVRDPVVGRAEHEVCLHSQNFSSLTSDKEYPSGIMEKTNRHRKFRHRRAGKIITLSLSTNENKDSNQTKILQFTQ
jgi:hypothetical protein